MKHTIKAPECGRLPEALDREWLVVNGIGGYASGTIAGCNSRKYHGLLVAQLTHPVGLYVLLSQLEDSFEGKNGRAWPLSTHEYPGTFFPDGCTHLERFEMEGGPVFHYRCGTMRIIRRVLMAPGRNAVLIRYEATGPDRTGTLLIRPQLAFRDIHATAHENSECHRDISPFRNGFLLRLYMGMPALRFASNRKSSFHPEPLWYRHVLYRRDADRGFDYREDLFSPGELRLRLRPGEPVILAVSVSADPVGRLSRVWDRAAAHLRRPAPAIPKKNSARLLLDELAGAARQFLIRRPDTGAAVHAGYHWFAPWGRDGLIGLPGLTFATGNRKVGEEILRDAVQLEHRGLLPNFVNADGTPAYTAADPALWLFWTVQQYLAFGGDIEWIRREMWPVLRTILEQYRTGTSNRIHADPETGLISAGAPGMTTTWMDARIGGRPVVPRWGFMVELNALWYNALCCARELGDRFNDPIKWLDDPLCANVREAFEARFWLADQETLLDTFNDFVADDTVRPNQVLAVSLPHSPLAPAKQRVVVELVHQELFTPRGLRSLTPRDIRYRSTCDGDHLVRDLAYHQGSVWPWLLAHFGDAWFRVHGRTPEATRIFDPVIESFIEHLDEAGLGSISEIFDGDPPHMPRGAIAQAWNVGELIRLLHSIETIRRDARGRKVSRTRRKRE